MERISPGKRNESDSHFFGTYRKKDYKKFNPEENVFLLFFWIFFALVSKENSLALIFFFSPSLLLSPASLFRLPLRSSVLRLFSDRLPAVAARRSKYRLWTLSIAHDRAEFRSETAACYTDAHELVMTSSLVTDALFFFNSSSWSKETTVAFLRHHDVIISLLWCVIMTSSFLT